MPYSSYPLDAYLIIDNNAIVGLCEFFCDTHKKLPFTDMIQAACKELSDILTVLRRFALGNKLFTTKCVLDEFKPEFGEIQNYYGFDLNSCKHLKSHLHSEIEAANINMTAIAKLRAMQQTPGRFGTDLSRLSDPDLSLVILALGIAKESAQRVYVITDDEDLRIFISWMKPRSEVKSMCQHSDKVDGLHSMIYMDCVHRKCAFTTLQISTMLTFHSLRQMSRIMLSGTTKGEMITRTIQTIYESIRESGRIKQKIMEGAI